MSARGVARFFGRLGLYAAVVAWLTWPLAAHLTSHLPSTAGAPVDSLYSAWALSWESHALAHGVSLLDANAYHPAPRALLFGPPGFGALPYFAPVFLATGNPALALNLLFLGSVALAAASVHTVAWWWTGLETAGAVAAATFLLSRWLLWAFVPNTPHFAVLWYLPLIVAGACTARLGRRAAVCLALLVVAQGLTDIVYVAPAVVLPLVLLALSGLARTRTRLRGAQLLGVLTLAVLVLLALHAPYLLLAWSDPDLVRRSVWSGHPPPPRALPWEAFAPFSPVAIPTVALGLIALGGAVAIGRRLRRGSTALDRPWAHAALWAAMSAAVALPLAPPWLLPPVLRVPERLAVSGLVGLALLAGLAFAELVRRTGPTRAGRGARAALAAGLGLSMYTQYAGSVGQPAVYGAPLPAAYPLWEAPRGDSAVLEALRTSPGPTVELPIWRFPPVEPGYHVLAMYRSIFHRQPMLNGYASYWPAGFPELVTLMARLPEAAAVDELRRRAGLRYILLRRQAFRPVDVVFSAPLMELETNPSARDRAGLELVAADGTLVLFRVRDHPVPHPPAGPVR